MIDAGGSVRRLQSKSVETAEKQSKAEKTALPFHLKSSSPGPAKVRGASKSVETAEKQKAKKHENIHTPPLFEAPSLSLDS